MRDMLSALNWISYVTLMALVWGGTGCSSSSEQVEVASIDPETLTRLVQASDDVERIEHSWGWLQWLMNDKIDPDAEMTFGLVQIDAGQDNPLHTHPNCEEILYMLSGSCDHAIGDQVVTLEAGQMIRIPAGVPHRAIASEAGPMQAVIVYSDGNRQFVIVEP